MGSDLPCAATCKLTCSTLLCCARLACPSRPNGEGCLIPLLASRRRRRCQGAGGHGDVRPRVPHQVLQRHLRAPGPHHRHWYLASASCCVLFRSLTRSRKKTPAFSHSALILAQGSGGIGSGCSSTPRGEAAPRGWSPSSRSSRWSCRRRPSPRTGSPRPRTTWVWGRCSISQFSDSLHEPSTRQ